MLFHIYKKKKEPGIPYDGATCERLGIEKGKVYKSISEAKADAKRMSDSNPAGFEVAPFPIKQDAYWISGPRWLVSTPIPCDWQANIVNQFRGRLFVVGFSETWMRFRASSMTAMEILEKNNSYLYVEEVLAPDVN